MRALLDTNIIIHREASTVVQPTIGKLFAWLDRLKYEKCVHPVTLEEIKQHNDERVRKAFSVKLEAYSMIKTTAPMADEVESLSTSMDNTPNDRNDTIILNELFCNRVDILISEDRGILRKADLLGIFDRVFTIDSFLEKVVSENPELVDYHVLSVKKELFGNTNIESQFFDSFRSDYPGFDSWFNRKADETAYLCYQDSSIVAFLYLKVEDHTEPYTDIVPVFAPARRLKIGTFKVEINGFKGCSRRMLKKSSCRVDKYAGPLTEEDRWQRW